ncbi:MAG: N4-gp56 family major capsid protein [Rhodocyclaceae bacterium]|nr:N4-gp56 family major capsid protein [Rhodocyclaceae bacterium]
MATTIRVNDPIAVKAYSAALFAKVQEAPGFMRLLSGKMPTLSEFRQKATGQSKPGYPIVKAGDLAKGAGEAVQITLFNSLSGKPTMGDRKIDGRMMALTASSMDLRINQVRFGADAGGRMTQKRTAHNLRAIACAGLQDVMQRYEDQSSLVHLAGARGSQDGVDWTIPFESDPEFRDILVNPVLPPTKNRHFFANDATSIENIGTNDVLTTKDIDRIVTSLRESSAPLQAVQVNGDTLGWDKPLWVMLVTARQWYYLRKSTAAVEWKQAEQHALARKQAGIKHPLFDATEMIMWSGVLVRPINRYAIRFNAGDKVKVDSGGADGRTYTEVEQTAAQVTDRAILLGAEALAKAYGKTQSDYFYDWNEELVDHGNSVEIVTGTMTGAAKVRFKLDGVQTDHGVAVIDSYAPPVDSPEGRALVNI